MKQKSRTVTLKTIGDILGVKPTTVSKALRDATDISEETRQKVRQVAQQLGYRPNLMARSLAQKRSKMIGAIVPSFATSFYPEIIKGFYQQAREKGYQLFLSFSNENEEIERDSLEYFASLGVDGILISVTQTTTDTTLFEKLHQQGLPILFYDRILEGLNVSSVISDDRNGAFQIVEHLIQIGKHQILFLGRTDYPSVCKYRYAGYQEAIRRNQLEEHALSCDFNKDQAYRMTSNFIHLNQQKIDAIFCSNDLIAVGAYQAICEAGLKIPADIALTGFGDTVESLRYPLSLTTVNQPAFEMGEKAVEVLIEEINSENEDYQPQQIVLDTKLVIRDSTDSSGTNW